MPIRLSGMSSGLDTDTIVKELVAAYSTKKDSLVKAQTKLEWKQDSWKDMNSKIYNFYSKSLSNLRFSSAYSLKSASITDTAVAKVSASATAVSGTQTLIVDKLSASGYLTGGVVKGDEGVALKGSSKLSELADLDLQGGKGTIDVTVNGKTKSIEVTDDTTINQFVTALKEGGVDANFDEKNQRLFVSAKVSGEENDFSLTAGNANGLAAMKALGIYVNNTADMAEYEKWANYTDDEIAAAKQAAFDKNKYTTDNLLKTYTADYKAAKSKVEELNKKNEELQDKLDKLNADLGNDTLTEEDKTKIEEEITKVNESIEANNEEITKQQAVVDDMAVYVPAEDDTDDVKATKTAALEAKVAELNEGVKAAQDAAVDAKVAMAKDVVANGITSSEGAVRTVGQDSRIILNGATFTSNTNNYEINGLTIQAMQESKDGKATTITTGTDVDGIYNVVKDFIKSYNELIIDMDKAFNASSSKGYEPLTDEEKEAMSDKEIEKWETKIKDSLLRRDDTLGSISDMMKSAMLRGFDVNGKRMTLSSFGISTSGYFSSGDNERGAYHIDGDADDAATAGNTDKLKAAIANDPESVMSFFTQLSSNLYDGLTKKMAGTTMSSAYTVYNDKKMKSDYDDYKDKISSWEDKLEKMEQRYYKQFSAMETALSKLNASTSSLTGLLGG